MYTIIGGGPIGLASAFELSKRGFRTRVLEEHKEIGEPVQCTGIVTKELLKLMKPDKDVVLNQMRSAIIHSKNNSTEIRLNDLVIDRAGFDKQLCEMATSEGAVIKKDTRIDKIKRNKSGFELSLQNKTGKIKTDVLIGADGPASKLRELMNPKVPKKLMNPKSPNNSSYLRNNINYLVGKQARVKGKFEPDKYHVYFGSDFPGFFGWVVPENEKIARIGLASEKNVSLHFKRFIERFNPGKNKILEYNHGLIPLYNPGIKTESNNSYLVGDAAGQVKATTGGGIVPGLKAAKCLSEAIANNKSYHKMWKKEIGLELLLHQKIRKSLDSFSNKDYDNLVNILRNSKDILEKNNRDNMKKIIFPLAIKNPGILRFIKNIRL